MYIPKHFEVRDRAVLHDLMQRYSFATVVTAQAGRPVATHMPVVLEPERGAFGTLVTHMARGNEQWRAFDAQTEALVIFQGDHAYISPSWYESHPSVPTWNYMTVHAYGTPVILEDERRVEEALRALVEQYERGRANRWEMSLPEDYLHKMMRGIVAFEIEIRTLEGKFKLSQNRAARDQQIVREALSASADPLERGIAQAMQEAARGAGE